MSADNFAPTLNFTPAMDTLREIDMILKQNFKMDMFPVFL